MSNYKTRYLQSIYNSTTFERNNLKRFRDHKVSKDKRSSYKLNYYHKKRLDLVIRLLTEALRILRTFKGVEE